MNTFRKHLEKIVLPTFFVVLLVVTGCSEPTKVRIGVSQCSSDDWREKMNDEIMREAMLKDDVEVVIRSANDDVSRQIADIDYFVDEGFDVIAIAPIEARSLTPAVHRAMDNGVPVLLFDRETEDDRFTAYVGADNEAIGRMAARQLAHDMPDGAKILEIRGLDSSTPALGRAKGFRTAVDSLGAGYEIVASVHGQWIDSIAGIEARKALEAHPEVNMIYAHNDRMAIAASAVKTGLGRDSIRVYGIDAAPKIGIKAVADGVIDATFFYPTEGEFMFRMAADMATGKNVPKRTLLPSPEPVTRDNAELLLLQDRAIDENTAKIGTLRERLERYLTLQSTQRLLLTGAVVILLLMATLLFVIMRLYWSHRSHQAVLAEQNAHLERQKHELESLNEEIKNVTAARMVFFTNVSHDLRTPLTLIADPVEQMTKADNLTPRQKTLMALANKNVKILQRLINQILDFRTAENDKMVLNPVEVNLGDCVREWAEAFDEAAHKRHINLEVNIADSSKELTLAADVEKIERVFFNLLSNAFKFTPANGRVTVGVSADNKDWHLSVADTGCGIESESLNLIFDRFFKSDRINPTGSGIGLALTKAFVELNGGVISVESTPGEGTRFDVVIPIRHTANTLSPEDQRPVITRRTITDELADIEEPLMPEISENDENRLTALIIDDNADIRTLVSSVLGDEYAVLQASGGASGIRMASKFSPDVIICDIMMPDIDGLETCRRLKSEVTTSHIPVLMLTACADDQQRITGYNAGADGYISKPFNSDVLIARVKALISNRAILKAGNPGDQLTSRPTKEPGAAGQVPMGVDLDNDFFRRFVELVNSRIADSELSVEDVASEMGLSRVQFYRKIKALTNYSPAEMMRIIRLKRADQLIKTTEDTISEIAYAVGFSSPGYFTKCYREYFSETPGDARRRTSGAK